MVHWLRARRKKGKIKKGKEGNWKKAIPEGGKKLFLDQVQDLVQDNS